MYQSDNALADKVADRLWHRMASQVGTGLKAVSSTPGGNYGHGPGGLFSNPALERPLYSAMITPFAGLQYVLPVRGTSVTDPLDGIITGVTDTTGSEASGVCDDPPTTGLVKLCQHSFPLGLFARQTPVYNVRYGTRLASRGEHTDFQVFGDPFNAPGASNGFAPSIPGVTTGEMANTNSGKVIWAWMVAWARDFAKTLYNGNPANNTAGGGYAEFYGLDELINTGYRDAVTGQACAAADSIVRDFANQNIRSASSTFVTTMLETMWVLMDLGARVNLAPVRWVIVMSHSAFYEATRVWPCSYLTDGCSLSGNAQVHVDAGDQIRMRDEMRGNMASRTGQHLKMFGIDVPVIVDDAITENGLGGGVQSSSIYFVPITVLGGQPVTYMEYMDYNAIGVPQDAARFAPEGHFQTTDNGRFLLVKKPPTNLCVQLAAYTEPRLKLLTPYLAARIDRVAYNRLGNLRSGFPEDTAYFVNGGRTNYVGFGPSFFSPTT